MAVFPLMLYLIALGWIWMGLGTVQAQDWYLRLAQAVLLVAALILFGLQVVADSGARELHQAYLMAQRLADRQDWPSNLEEIKDLPDVKAFRAMLKADVTPAFALLRHESAQVRLAALAALEYHRDLRPGQAELLLEVAQQSPEPEVRAAAISALANVTDRTLGEKVAAFMRDPSSRVRRAANEALLWDTENRWIWLREPVRRALSDPALQDDGPLIHHGPLFCTEAINDLQAWTAETGALAMRASLTLVAHYERALNEKSRPATDRESASPSVRYARSCCAAHWVDTTVGSEWSA
ncbi:MAG: hypothetical protein KatS3mg105_0314 [Gemmatales bacterium]|nr:MAG: hypothetical protein KatS3mg105_0314 [Gemmatales bacterium]